MAKLRGINILVVDDEEDICDILRDAFIEQGANVQKATNANDAFNIIMHSVVDVVISDMRMPGGDGVFLMKNIRDKSDLPPKIFLCSAYNQYDFETLKKDYNIISSFSKPFNIKEIVEILVHTMRIEA